MAKREVVRNNPNIGFDFSDLNIPRNLASRQESRRSNLNVNPILKIDRRGRENRPGLLSQQIINNQTSESTSDINLDTAEETKKQIDNLIADEGTDLNKHTGLGNMLARLGGAQIATEEERAAATPELRELYNQQRLAARNKGIGQMLFALSDALGGRDVVGRLLERQAAMQPEEESSREKINQEIFKTYQELEKVGGDPKKLSQYYKAIYDANIAPTRGGYSFDFSGQGTNNANQSNNQNEEEDEADRIAQKYLQPS
tara:strand:+ start:3274 stop:4047 length:774 start_codon:yes stop_codon:yes gene_type:complete